MQKVMQLGSQVKIWMLFALTKPSSYIKLYSTGKKYNYWFVCGWITKSTALEIICMLQNKVPDLTIWHLISLTYVPWLSICRLQSSVCCTGHIIKLFACAIHKCNNLYVGNCFNSLWRFLSKHKSLVVKGTCAFDLTSNRTDHYWYKLL